MERVEAVETNSTNGRCRNAAMSHGGAVLERTSKWCHSPRIALCAALLLGGATSLVATASFGCTFVIDSVDSGELTQQAFADGRAAVVVVKALRPPSRQHAYRLATERKWRCPRDPISGISLRVPRRLQSSQWNVVVPQVLFSNAPVDLQVGSRMHVGSYADFRSIDFWRSGLHCGGCAPMWLKFAGTAPKHAGETRIAFVAWNSKHGWFLVADGAWADVAEADKIAALVRELTEARAKQEAKERADRELRRVEREVWLRD